MEDKDEFQQNFINIIEIIVKNNLEMSFDKLDEIFRKYIEINDKDFLYKSVVENMNIEEKRRVYHMMVEKQVKFLKTTSRKGVIQGGLKRNNFGKVIGRYGRVSKNPLWYRKLYETLGRCPSNKDLIKEAETQLRNGLETDLGFCPPDKLFLVLDEEINGKRSEENSLCDLFI